MAAPRHVGLSAASARQQGRDLKYYFKTSVPETSRVIPLSLTYSPILKLDGGKRILKTPERYARAS